MISPDSTTASTADCKIHAEDSSLEKSSLCFSQLAENPMSNNTECACPQGCDRCVRWGNPETVIFKNKASAVGCPFKPVLLTVSRTYFTDTTDLKLRCPEGGQNCWK